MYIAIILNFSQKEKIHNYPQILSLLSIPTATWLRICCGLRVRVPLDLMC